ncbi:hypothetical protein GLOIN_2v1883000 [Rhizophagus irregularis DAOM 181602=DAOM 197198]|uniref:Uncharacterized protein n=1 Tax=Rhizophagus irregularis (strain DAOM 181602 / DAOM 197198 / MUCL 43194) TaxID=747089 RepID=A0A2P4PA29_RHIID|nr:hypothetical protein GLOIN_2v1883000 [Rhizophagus irregularis DAOM 181602=DAOM 197198]POG62250.1 hypothetical protein GLOIN_2v1883000 [Rhizophagus irregularis DAOM 181602=DAOM 197198]|eukprot:XP_025169116.1 hypothetical protein GLOIN_2v1883000 [Rhizophagus irregularis DAOM 181602=DAOM 197198]
MSYVILLIQISEKTKSIRLIKDNGMSKSTDNDKKDDIEKEVDYESEWRNICEKANKWVVSKQLSKEELEELDSACDQYLIEKAVEAYNNQTINVQVTKLDVDETTKITIYNGLRSDAKISSPEEAVETLKSYVGSLRLRRLDKKLYSACEQYLIQQGCEFLNSKNTTIVTEVLNKPSQSVIYGSDGPGAAARAKCKVELERAQNKTLEYVSKATDLALKYTEDEVNRLFDNNVTHGNKDDVLNRAKRATKFLMDNQVDIVYNNDRDDTFNEEEDSRYMTQTYNFSLDGLSFKIIGYLIIVLTVNEFISLDLQKRIDKSQFAYTSNYHQKVFDKLSIAIFGVLALEILG